MRAGWNGWRASGLLKAQSADRAPGSMLNVKVLSLNPDWRHPKVAICLAIAGAGFAGCAQQPHQQMARSKEYFPSSIYGKASPRVVADGEAVPRGGGQYLVGKPYTVAGRTYYPEEKKHLTQVGLASWYGDAFHGRRTANGEIYDRDSISAAHPTMPLPSYARVTNLRNAHSIIVRVNDRGPFAPGRVMDVSRGTAEALDFKRTGTAMVKIDYISPAGLQGSDDRKLLATLRLDGRPASLNGQGDIQETAVAEAEPVSQPEPQRVASLAPTVPQPRSAEVSSDRQSLNNMVEGIAKPSGKMSENAPLPPARPFDLKTIPGAGAQISSR